MFTHFVCFVCGVFVHKWWADQTTQGKKPVEEIVKGFEDIRQQIVQSPPAKKGKSCK